jgi:hypothetical protein
MFVKSILKIKGSAAKIQYQPLFLRIGIVDGDIEGGLGRARRARLRAFDFGY